MNAQQWDRVGRSYLAPLIPDVRVPEGPSFKEELTLLILKKRSIPRKVALEFRRLGRCVPVLPFIAMFASFVTILGLPVAALWRATPNHDFNTLLAGVVLICLCISVFYMTKYYRLKESVSRFDEYPEAHHAISHCVRSMCIIRHPKDFADMVDREEIDERAVCEKFLLRFRTEAARICSRVQQALVSQGLPIHHVCIKRLDRETNTLRVMGRTEQSSRALPTDDSEHGDDNPFYCLMRQAHLRHAAYVNKYRDHARQHRWADSPRFLAISGIRAVEHSPLVGDLFTDMLGAGVFARDPNVCEVDDFIERLKKRAKGNYESCLAVLITDDSLVSADGHDGTRIVPSLGYIGVDSKSDNPWDFLEESHVSFLCSVADSLYCALDIYGTVLTRLKEITDGSQK